MFYKLYIFGYIIITLYYQAAEKIIYCNCLHCIFMLFMFPNRTYNFIFYTASFDAKDQPLDGLDVYIQSLFSMSMANGKVVLKKHAVNI